MDTRDMSDRAHAPALFERQLQPTLQTARLAGDAYPLGERRAPPPPFESSGNAPPVPTSRSKYSQHKFTKCAHA